MSVLTLNFAAPAWAMSINVRPLTGQNFAISADSADTVASVKQKIEDANGTPVADQRLVFAGRQLEDSRTLADYNIQDQSTIFLVLRLRPTSTSSQPEPTPIPMWFQSYARSSVSDACSTGWTPSWAEWPHGHTGGWTCDREIPSLG